jgi:AcrR family transcriptional regulator
MQQRSADTQQRILKSARDLFSSAGYDATGVSQICTAAGLSKGAFYHHFPSKHAVFMALLKEWLIILDEEALARHPGDKDVPASIARMAASADLIFTDGQGQFPMFLEFWQQSIRDELVWEETKQPFMKYLYYFSKLVEDGVQEGSIRPLDPATTARAILGLALGIILQSMLYPQQTDWKNELQISIDLLLRGMSNA